MSEWRNWAGDQACRPAAFERPSGTQEVAAAVRAAAAAGRTVRVAGAEHSFTGAVLTDGTLLSLERMSRVLDVDRASGLVRIQAGITLHDLNGVLWDHGLAVANLGDIDVQSIAGAAATGTHGTGHGLPNLSAALHSIELVTGDGSVVECNEESDPDAWRAARVGIGALGVVTEVTLRAVPAFTLEGVDAPMPLEATLERLGELAAGSEHFELFTFPHTGVALTRTNRRTDAPPAPRSAGRAWVDDILLRNHAFELACRIGRARPSLIPRLNRAVTRASGTTRRVDRSYEIFASPRRVRFTEMEYAVPRADGAEAVRSVLAMIGERRLPVPFPLEVRFVARDDALLSPATGRDTCYIAVHQYRGMAWEPLLRATEEIMDDFGGRPHWGKRHFQSAATLASRYPDWDRFAAVRARLDPEGRFANGYLRRVLGPVGAPLAA